jgi:hypothetical protein
VLIRDLSGIVKEASAAPELPGIQPLGGMAIQALGGADDALLVQVPAAGCRDPTVIVIEPAANGRPLIATDLQGQAECDAIGRALSIALHLAKPVPPEKVIRRTTRDGSLATWGVFVEDEGLPASLEIQDLAARIVSIEPVMPKDVPDEPPGIVTIREGPDRLRITWRADACEKNFLLRVERDGSQMALSMEALSVKPETCGLEFGPRGVALTFEGPISQDVGAILVHSR